MALSHVVTPPQAEPVAVADAMLQLSIDDEAMQPKLEPLLIDARERAEHELGRSLITQTRQMLLTCWPCCPERWNAVELDAPPVQEVTQVQYWADGWQTLPPPAYSLEPIGKHQHLLVPVGAWPSLGGRNGVRVRITYIAGFGDEGEAVPQAIRQWIVAMAGHALEDPTGQNQPNEFLNRRLDAWRTRI